MANYEFLLELKKKFGMNDDCFQMVLTDLLEYDNVKLNELQLSGEIRFWIVRFCKNYWFSKTSRYYATYKRYYEHFEPITED